MIISSINIFNTNNKFHSYKKQPDQINEKKDNITFKGSPIFLNHRLAESIASVAGAYEEILTALSRKTDEGIKQIEKEFGNIEFGRSLTFHDCGEAKTSIVIRVPENKTARDILKIVVKKGKDYPDNKIFLNSYTIADYNRPLKDEHPNHAYIFPEKTEYLTKEALKNGFSESVLENIIDDLDFQMLKLRKLLNRMSGQFLKPEIFTLGGKTLKQFENIERLYNETDNLIKSLPHKLSIKLRSEYGDYTLQAKQPTHILTNIGDNKNQIVYKKLEHPEHGTLTRLLIYNSDGEIVDGFLFDNKKRIVSNFNIEHFNIIPPKLNFYDEKSVNKIHPALEKYLELYEEKLNDFNTFLKQKILERKMTPVVGKIQGKTFDNLTNINTIYDDLCEQFSKLSPAVRSNLKTSYPKWHAAGGQRGFVFKTEDNEIISVLKMNSGKGNHLIRLHILKDGTSKYFLINHDNVVKNFNPKYPQMIPPVLKYYNDIELEQTGIDDCIKKTAVEMENFKQYIHNQNEKIVNEKIKPETKSSPKNKTVKTPVKKMPKNSKSDDYKKLIKECKVQFDNALKNAENNLENFNKILFEIQQKITEFFEKNNQ